jgi:hypothetical protein
MYVRYKIKDFQPDAGLKTHWRTSVKCNDYKLGFSSTGGVVACQKYAKTKTRSDHRNSSNRNHYYEMWKSAASIVYCRRTPINSTEQKAKAHECAP